MLIMSQPLKSLLEKVVYGGTTETIMLIVIVRRNVLFVALLALSWRPNTKHIHFT